MVKKKRATLIICEKPQAAGKIASALADSEEKKFSENGVSWYEFKRGGKDFIVGCAVGHLFGVAQELGKRASIPNFEVEWRPSFERKGSDYIKKYYDVLKKLCKEADKFIVATDYDVEGEVIGWNVVRFICGQKDAGRMKFSSLTQDELESAFDERAKTINWGAAMAGETRHYLDWYYGINLSRALMRALSKTGAFRILSVGRVQGPALNILVDREKKIKKFKPEPFWQVFMHVEDLNKNKVEVKYPKDLTKKVDLLKFKLLKGKKAVAETKIKDAEVRVPIPFDLTTLQTEAYRWLGMAPKQSMKVAQGLYLKGLISYPRTSSQEYPSSIGYDKILKKLKKHFSVVKYAVNKTPTKGKKTDPAHPAIYPTGNWGKMTAYEKKLYDLVAKRFIACFCEPAKVESKRITVSINGLKFHAHGTIIQEKNWIAVYPSSTKDEKIPTLNGEVKIHELRIEEKQTSPPNRYSPASLMRELEKRNLGTKATRTGIIDTLFSRDYVEGKSLEVTELGIKLVDTLKKYADVILDEELTRDIEKEMEEIESAKGKRDLDKKQKKMLVRAQKDITKIVGVMEKNKEKVGRALGGASKEMWEKQKKENKLQVCPVCKKGNLAVMYGRKFKRYFVACDAYPKCRTTFSLPPNCLVKPVVDKEGEKVMCEECGWPMLLALRQGRRPWRLCFNPDCKTNEEWEKKKKAYRKKMEKEGKGMVKEGGEEKDVKKGKGGEVVKKGKGGDKKADA